MNMRHEAWARGTRESTTNGRGYTQMGKAQSRGGGFGGGAKPGTRGRVRSQRIVTLLKNTNAI